MRGRVGGPILLLLLLLLLRRGRFLLRGGILRGGLVLLIGRILRRGMLLPRGRILLVRRGVVLVLLRGGVLLLRGSGAAVGCIVVVVGGKLLFVGFLFFVVLVAFVGGVGEHCEWIELIL